jgi:hypothetical protein
MKRFRSSIKKPVRRAKLKQKKKKVLKPIKQLKRIKGVTAESKKLKQRWMDKLLDMVGQMPIDWATAALYYDQGLPVQIAFQKLVTIKQKAEGKVMLGFKEYIAEAGFSSSQIKKLRSEYAKIDRIDPTSAGYKKMDAMLEKMSVEDLEKLIDAKIKFVSSLALAKVVRKKMHIK